MSIGSSGTEAVVACGGVAVSIGGSFFVVCGLEFLSTSASSVSGWTMGKFMHLNLWFLPGWDMRRIWLEFTRNVFVRRGGGASVLPNPPSFRAVAGSVVVIWM